MYGVTEVTLEFIFNLFYIISYLTKSINTILSRIVGLASGNCKIMTDKQASS